MFNSISSRIYVDIVLRNISAPSSCNFESFSHGNHKLKPHYFWTIIWTHAFKAFSGDTKQFELHFIGIWNAKQCSQQWVQLNSSTHQHNYHGAASYRASTSLFTTSIFLFTSHFTSHHIKERQNAPKIQIPNCLHIGKRTIYKKNTSSVAKWENICTFSRSLNHTQNNRNK